MHQHLPWRAHWTLRDLLMHVLSFPALAWLSHQHGSLSTDDMRAAHARLREVMTCEAIAASGAGVRQHILACVQRNDTVAFDRVVPAHDGGEVTVLALLTIILSHRTHHLQQAYWFMHHELGCSLSNPMTDEDVAGMVTPEALFSREERGHEDDTRIVLRHGGGRHSSCCWPPHRPGCVPSKTPPTPSASATMTSAAWSLAPQGPEAGVWVIAETTDLPTKFAKIVVTDEQGRYVMPDLPKANYSVWVRGYGLVDSPKVQSDARQDPQPDGGAGAECGGSGAVLSGDLLVCHAQDPGQERVPRHRAARQRPAAEPEESGATGWPT